MLVASMNFEELRKEVMKDFVILERKLLYDFRRAEKYMRKTNTSSYLKISDYYSKHKNTWIYRELIEKGESWYSTLVYYFGRKGLTAITVDSKREMIHLYTSHFLKRFNERLELRVVKPEDLLRIYISLNHNIHYHDLEVTGNGIIKIMGKTETGIVLGYRIEEKKLIKLNTFLSLDMLKKDQVERELSLRTALDKYSGETHSFD